MISRVTFEEKAHIAFVLSENFTYDDIIEFRETLTFLLSLIDTESVTIPQIHLKNLSFLLSEMEVTPEQGLEMMRSYFDPEVKRHGYKKTLDCKIEF